MTCRVPPPPARWSDTRQRFLNVLGLKINDEHDKSFVKLLLTSR